MTFEGLNKMESAVFQMLIDESESNGHDFGMTEAVGYQRLGITGKQFSGYMSQLSQKGYIEVTEHSRQGNPRCFLILRGCEEAVQHLRDEGRIQ